MPKLSEVDFPYQHILLCGHSGTGKTGSLVSLVAAGYKLYILDLDNGIQILKNLILEQCPDKLDQVEVEQVSDVYKIGKLGARPTAGVRAMVQVGKIIDTWQKEVEWDDKTVLVIDSLTALGRACLTWAAQLNTVNPDTRVNYRNAQEVITPLIETLTSPEAKHHLLVLTHVNLVETRDEKGRITATKCFPSSIGAALNDRLPTHFNSVFEYDTIGTGKNVRRKINSVSSILDLKNPSPNKVKASYTIETGLAELFSDLTK